MGRAPRTRETLPDFCELCRVCPTFTSFPRVDGQSTDTPVLGRHINSTSLYDLSHESVIGRRPKHELITRSPRMVNNHTVHSHPTRRNVIVHMNAMMPIHISNSNGSYTIIFHIIQTIMLRHQLACVNISFPIHISSHSIQAITYKQNTWTNFSVQPSIRTFNSPIIVRGLSMDSPPHQASVPLLWDRNPWPFSASQQPKPFSWPFKQRISK